jgi:polyisoprenoid-binding protein YceI
MTRFKPFTAATALAWLASAALPLAAQAEAATYAIDPTHTFVTFEVDHFATSTNRGRFDKKDGSVTLDRAAKTGRVELTIDMASLNTGVVPFTKHLSSKDFFDVAQFPTARFVADGFSFDGDKVKQVAGTLTLLGKAQPVVLKAERFNCYLNPMLKREVCGGDFETTIARSQWGMDWGLKMGFTDSVRLLVQVEAVRQ